MPFKRFGKRWPDVVVSIEERVRMQEDKKALKRDTRHQTRRGEGAQG